MTGSTSTPTVAEMEVRLMEQKLRAAEREEECAAAREKRAEERREEEHRARTAAIIGNSSHHEEPKGETSIKVLEVSAHLPSIPRVHLQAIFEGKFDPYNLHKLRALHADEDSGLQQLSFDEGKIQVQKPKGKLKDYGLTYTTW